MENEVKTMAFNNNSNPDVIRLANKLASVQKIKRPTLALQGFILLELPKYIKNKEAEVNKNLN